MADIKDSELEIGTNCSLTVQPSLALCLHRCFVGAVHSPLLPPLHARPLPGQCKLPSMAPLHDCPLNDCSVSGHSGSGDGEGSEGAEEVGVQGTHKTPAWVGCQTHAHLYLKYLAK